MYNYSATVNHSKVMAKLSSFLLLKQKPTTFVFYNIILTYRKTFFFMFFFGLLKKYCFDIKQWTITIMINIIHIIYFKKKYVLLKKKHLWWWFIYQIDLLYKLKIYYSLEFYTKRLLILYKFLLTSRGTGFLSLLKLKWNINLPQMTWTYV